MAKRKKNQPMDRIALRGCLEYQLRNAFTGDVLQKGNGDNHVLFVGRAWALRKVCESTMAATDVISSMSLGTTSSGYATSNSKLAGYFTFLTMTGAMNTATNASPYVQFTGSIESTNLTITGYNQIWEMGLANTTGDVSMFSRYVTTGTCINATTSNQLLFTYTVSN